MKEKVRYNQAGLYCSKEIFLPLPPPIKPATLLLLKNLSDIIAPHRPVIITITAIILN